MKRILVLLALATMSLGCGSGDDGSPNNTGGTPDASADAAAEGAPNDGPAGDVSPDATGEAGEDVAVQDAPDAPVEAAPDAPVEAAPDAPVEAAPDALVEAAPDAPVEAATDGGPPWDAGNRPPGQCGADSDCPGTLTCVMSAPGGLCTGCGIAADCGNPLEFECFQGTCVRQCSDDTDCAWGYICATGSGRCRLIGCGSGTCPVPYVCEGNLCRRPVCASTPPACPEGTTCGQGDYCVENQP